MMRILFELNHPKHYYQFKYVIAIMSGKGHDVFVVARDKDVLLKVLEENKVLYEIFGHHKKNLMLKVLSSVGILYSYLKIINRIKPDIIISKASFYSVFLAKLTNRKSIIFPDSEVVKLTNFIVAPMAHRVITPSGFQLDFGKKHCRIPGFFEDCYLHPSVFSFDENMPGKFNIRKPYVILRFIGWNANHDFGESGISDELKVSIVHYLKAQYHIYISTEKALSAELMEYTMSIPASAIHHILAGADLYIGDSQTMATEAALLGTPSIRCNSFVGDNDMSNFIVLEEKYQMLVNVRNNDDIFKYIDKLITPESKQLWQSKRDDYYSQTGNPNDLIVKYIEEI